MVTFQICMQYFSSMRQKQLQYILFYFTDNGIDNGIDMYTVIYSMQYLLCWNFQILLVQLNTVVYIQSTVGWWAQNFSSF